MSGASVMSNTPRRPDSCLPHHRARRVHQVAGAEIGRAQPGHHSLHRAEQPQRDRELVPSVVEREDPGARLDLLHLPHPGVERNIPPAEPGADHLHGEADGLTDRAGLHDLLHAPQRLVEHEVLHHPQGPPGAVGGGDHAVGFGECRRHRLLHVHVVAGFERGTHHVGVGRRGYEHVDDVEVGGEEVVEIGEALARRGTRRHVPRAGRRWCRTTRRPSSWGSRGGRGRGGRRCGPSRRCRRGGGGSRSWRRY